jgi:hypothetical protein
VVGALDGTAAVTDAAIHGVSPTRLFQFVAAGLLGRSSFQGGLATFLLGVFLEFFIALCVMAVYYGASRIFPVLVRHAVLCGMTYGILVFFFMNNLVVPLSSAPRGPFHFSRWITQLFIHIFFVGLPAALVTRASTRGRT